MDHKSPRPMAVNGAKYEVEKTVKLFYPFYNFVCFKKSENNSAVLQPDLLHNAVDTWTELSYKYSDGTLEFEDIRIPEVQSYQFH